MFRFAVLVSILSSLFYRPAMAGMSGGWEAPTTVFTWSDGHRRRTQCRSFGFDLRVLRKRVIFSRYQLRCTGPEVHFEELIIQRVNERLFHNGERVGTLLGTTLHMNIPLEHSQREIRVDELGSHSLRYEDNLIYESGFSQTLRETFNRDSSRN